MKPVINILRYLLATSLIAMFAQQSFAQDAFYIYRNDGDFDGFFYDQVKRMGYSKFDLDSVEHSVYVVQEVETEDSLYRIPLAAIDSIGFQQPEFIYSPKLKNLDELGMTDYVIDSYNSTITFRLDTPSNLLPQVGDVLVSYDNPKYYMGVYPIDDAESASHERGGFGGKVTSVTKETQYNCWIVQTTPLSDISDVFVQFVSVEQVGTDKEGNVKRRVAGLEYDEESKKWVRKGKSGSGSVNLVNFNATLHADKDLGNGDAASVELGIGVKVTIQAAYNISWKRVFFKLDTSYDTSVGMGLALKSSKEFEAEITGIPPILQSIKFPAVCPIFQTKPLPMAFIRGGGELAAKLKSPTFDFGFRQSISYDTDNDFTPFRFTFRAKGADSEEAEDTNLFNTGDLELSLSGFVQAGLKFSANIGTNDWISDIIHSLIACDLYVGPKVEGALSISTAKLMQSGAYSSLNDSYIKLHAISSDIKAHASVKFLWYKPKYFNFLDYSEQFGTVEWKLFPSFKASEASFNKETEQISAKIFPIKKTFIPNTICIGLYNASGERVDQYEHYKPWFITESFDEASTTFSTSNLPCGYYTIRPYLKVAGYEIDVPTAWKEIAVTPTIKVSQKNVEVNGNSQSKEISFNTNATDVLFEVLSDENLGFNWLDVSIASQDEVKDREGSNAVMKSNSNSRTINIRFNKCNSFWPRSAKIVLKAKYGNFLSTDTIKVKQNPSSDLEIIDVSGRVQVPGKGNYTLNDHTTGTKYSYVYKWGDSNEIDHVESAPIDYGNSDSKEGSQTIIVDALHNRNPVVTCSRNGNLIVARIDDSFENFEPTGTTNEVSYEEIRVSYFEVVLDVSENPAKVVSGKAVYEYKTKRESVWDNRDKYEHGSREVVSGNSIYTNRRYLAVDWSQNMECEILSQNENGITLKCTFEGSAFSSVNAEYEISNNIRATNFIYDDWPNKYLTEETTRVMDEISRGTQDPNSGGYLITVQLTAQ